MARIAFYAPLKSPNHAVPSGERAIARNLMQLLHQEDHAPVLVSELRSLDKRGEVDAQGALLAQAAAEQARLIAEGQREGWAAWVTYHSYYKAPDLLGPDVSRALGIPYVLIEATRASKRLGGPWDAFERNAVAAIEAADVIFSFTERDARALRANPVAGQQLVSLPPFLPQDALAVPVPSERPSILAAGMMRAGDKLASYDIVAQALAHLPDAPWQLEIAGDGPMRAEVAALMAPFGARVTFLGQLDAAAMAAAYRRARVFFWPGVNEAFGMVYLEAQRFGVPVVAQDRPGVNEVVPPSGLHAPERPEALAQGLWEVLNDPNRHAVRAQEAQALIQARHLLPAARARVWGVLGPLMTRHLNEGK